MKLFIQLLLFVNLMAGSDYPSFCEQAANDASLFATFKSDPTYREMLEHVSYEEGVHYLQYIAKEYPELIPYFDQFRLNDTIGSPIVYTYGSYGRFSPTTLRYIKVAGDLKKHHGDLSHLNIVEIGGGYGGQCYILSVLGGFASYTMIDLAPCHALSEKVLEKLAVRNVTHMDHDNLTPGKSYDLLISNYAFSEVGEVEQHKYLEAVVPFAQAGYMTMNFIYPDAVELDELLVFLYKQGMRGAIERERPNTHFANLIINWSSKQKEAKPISSTTRQSAVTYQLSGGRFGDNLLAYFHAKWLSYKHGLRFLYKPFPYSDRFTLHDEGRLPPLRNTRLLKKESDVWQMADSWLHVVPYFPESLFEHYFKNEFPCRFEVEWDDPGFREIISQCLTPKEPIAILQVPKDCLTVAVHVRRGGGYDDPHVPPVFALKFPPDSYYIQQLERIANIFENERIFVYIFTDDKDPTALLQKYQQTLNDPRFEFACREDHPSYEITMLEDFFSIPKFDCAILCQSNFSLMASKLGDYALIILPAHYSDGCINSIEVIFNGKRK